MTIISNRRNVIVDEDEPDYDGSETISISSAIATASDSEEDEDAVDEEEENSSSVSVDDQDSADEEWQVRQMAVARRTVLPEDGPSARDMEREERDWAEVDTTDSTDALDDPVRMYLREIGRVDLLTSADERRLARELEGLNHLLKLEQELAERAASDEAQVDYLDASHDPPLEAAAWEAAMVLLARIANAAPLVRSLARYLELYEFMTLAEVKESPPSARQSTPRWRRQWWSRWPATWTSPRKWRTSESYNFPWTPGFCRPESWTWLPHTCPYGPNCTPTAWAVPTAPNRDWTYPRCMPRTTIARYCF